MAPCRVYDYELAGDSNTETPPESALDVRSGSLRGISIVARISDQSKTGPRFVGQGEKVDK